MSLLLLVPALGQADPQAYFSIRDNLQSEVVSAIDRCTSSIDAALFELNSPALAQALQRAVERGVEVRLLMNEKNPPSVLHDLQNSHLQLRFLGGRSPHHRGLMHNKFAIFDKASVETGSFNWTSGAQYTNYENALFEDNDAVVTRYSEQFVYLWTLSEEQPNRTVKRYRRRKRHAG